MRIEDNVVGTRKKRANKLSGKQWLINSISVWDDLKKTAEEAKLGHPASFPVALPYRLIESLTTDDDRVIIDPFVGIGSTLIAAKRLDRSSIGFDISQEYLDIESFAKPQGIGGYCS